MIEWVWSNGGMILTGENWSTVRGTLYSVCGRWMNEYGAMVEWYWQKKTEVLGEEHYTACVVDEWMSMEQWWNDTDRGKLKYWERNIIQRVWYEWVWNIGKMIKKEELCSTERETYPCASLTTTSHIDWLKIKPRIPRWMVGVWSRESWHGP
jgi:hypothetical protein